VTALQWARHLLRHEGEPDRPPAQRPLAAGRALALVVGDLAAGVVAQPGRASWWLAGFAALALASKVLPRG
jgi:hypothetical protein